MSRVQNTLDGPFGAMGIPDSDPIPLSDESWLVPQSDPSFAEVAFWFWRVKSLHLTGNLTARRIDTGTTESLTVNRVVERPWADETEPARTYGVGTFRIFEAGSTVFNFLSLQHDQTQEIPGGWRMNIFINFRFPGFGVQFSSSQIGGSSASSAAIAVLRGTDLVGKRNYEHGLKIYDFQLGGNTYTFTGELVIEPYLWWGFPDADGEALYDISTGEPLREDYLAL